MDAPWPMSLGWVRIAELGLGLLFVAAGVVKLAGVPFMVDLFTSLGFGQWLRYVAACIELGGGVLLFAGRYEFLAALALAVIMIGATSASVMVFNRSPIPPFLAFLLLLLIAWKRHPSGETAP
jgi:putative oxidoreductase